VTPLRELTIRAGEHSYARNEGKEQLRKVKRVDIHEEYNPRTFINDIAVLETDKPFHLNNFVQPITPASSGTVYKNGEQEC
jgi:secreted trypsin-like serine protease